MNKYYENSLPGPAEQVIALPIPARLIETFSKSGIVFAPTPQGEAMSDLFYFFWSAIVHFYLQHKRVNPVDTAINEAARQAGGLQLPAGLQLPVGVPNMVDAANPPAAGGGEDMNEDGRQTHFESDGVRYPYIALFWETMHGGNTSKPIGYVLWIASWAPNGLGKLISSHLKRCLAYKNDMKARPPCAGHCYSINDPLLMIKRIDDVFSTNGDRECVSYVDFRAFKAHEKHPMQFFAPDRLSLFFPNGWSVNAGRAPSIESPTLPWFVQFIPFPVISSRSCTWDFPLYCIAKSIAEILSNTGGVVSDTARVAIDDAIENAVRERTINVTTNRSDYFYELSRDLLAYLRERNALDDDVDIVERRESGTRIFEQLPSMMTLPGESNNFVGNVSAGQFAVFSSMSRTSLPSSVDYHPLFEMVTRDLSPASNVLLKIVSMFHDLMGVHFGNRMCMTMSCFVNNLGCARPYVGTGLLPCIGLFGPKALGKNRAHDAAATLMNKHVILPFASVTPAVFRTNSNYNGMLLAVLETPKELLGIDGVGQPAPTPLSEVFKELLTSGGEIKSFNFNGGSKDQNMRTTTVSVFCASIAMRLICNHRRETFEKLPIGSRIMMLENQNFADAIDAQAADCFVDEHSGDAIESTLSAEGKEWVERMRVLFDVYYVYCAFQRLGQLPMLPEEPIRMVLDGMNERLRERGYDGYTMRVGTQITNEVRALSTFINIALWWEGGFGAAYRASHNTPFLNFDVLMEISRHQRVLEDAIVFVFTQNISLVQSPLRQAVSDELRAMFKATSPAPSPSKATPGVPVSIPRSGPHGVVDPGGASSAVGVWNEALVTDRVVPNPMVHGEESVVDQRLRENYVQLNVSIVELRKMLAARLKISTEEISTALNQIRDHEQCVIDGMPHPVYRVRGAYTDQKGFFLKRWIISGVGKNKSKKKGKVNGNSGIQSNSIYGEFLDMLYKSMSLDRTTPTTCITMFPSEVDGESIGLDGHVHVLGVPACVSLERRRNEFKTFTRPARSFYFHTTSGMSRHRTTDGEWVQRGFPVLVPADHRVIITHELLEEMFGIPGVQHEYPRAGIERALLERKEQIVARDLRKHLPRVMPHYSVLSDLWMPTPESSLAALALSPTATIAGSLQSSQSLQSVASQDYSSLDVQSTSTVSAAIEKEVRETREAYKDGVVKAYQRARTTHQSSAYGLFCLATACWRWCEAVLDASFETAASLERYIAALRDETTYEGLCRSFEQLVNVQREMHATLTAESAAQLEGIESSEWKQGFTCLLETLPVLSKKERAFMEMYMQYVDLRPIADCAEFIRPNYQAVEASYDHDVSSVTAAFEALKDRMREVRDKFKGKEAGARKGLDHPCTARNMTHVLSQHNVSLPNAARTVIESVNVARREAIACIACGDFATACAVDEQISKALGILGNALRAVSADARAAALAEVDKATVNFSGKLHAAWGSAALTALMPLAEKLPQIKIDSSLWRPNGGTQHVQEVREALASEPVRSARAINQLEVLLSNGKRVGEPMQSTGVNKRARMEECVGDGGDEDDVGDPMLSMQETLDEDYDAMNKMEWDVQRGWLAAFLYHRDLPLPSLPPVSSSMRTAMVAQVGGGTPSVPIIGSTLIVTPQSMSAILFNK